MAMASQRHVYASPLTASLTVLPGQNVATRKVGVVSSGAPEQLDLEFSQHNYMVSCYELTHHVNRKYLRTLSV